jgi:hypothetical protein
MHNSTNITRASGIPGASHRAPGAEGARHGLLLQGRSLVDDAERRGRGSSQRRVAAARAGGSDIANQGGGGHQATTGGGRRCEARARRVVCLSATELDPIPVQQDRGGGRSEIFVGHTSVFL